jgi:AraC family transcriptional activator FtrA
MKKIAVLTYNQAALFELGCAVELFALPRPEIEDWYQCDVVTFESGPMKTTAGLQITARQVEDLQAYDMLVIPSWPTNITQLSGLLADEVNAFYNAGKRILSFCSGAFLLAELGILDGRRATTHWRYAQKFQQRYKKVEYAGDVLYLFDGTIGCSAGSAAGLDLGLEVIRTDYGQQTANQVARRLVMSAHRNGGQSQYVDTPVHKPHSRFSQALDWAINNLHSPFSVNNFADKANMTRRTFDRQFRSTFDQTPGEWLIMQKLKLAKQLLESDTRNIELIAEMSGFKNATSMRHHFRKSLNLSPRQYRDQFSRTRHH